MEFEPLWNLTDEILGSTPPKHTNMRTKRAPFQSMQHSKKSSKACLPPAPSFFCAAARREPSLQFLGGNMIYLKSLIVHLVNHNTSLPFTYYFCERKSSGPQDFPKNQRSWPWYCQAKNPKRMVKSLENNMHFYGLIPLTCLARTN